MFLPMLYTRTQQATLQLCEQRLDKQWETAARLGAAVCANGVCVVPGGDYLASFSNNVLSSSSVRGRMRRCEEG